MAGEIRAGQVWQDKDKPEYKITILVASDPTLVKIRRLLGDDVITREALRKFYELEKDIIRKGDKLYWTAEGGAPECVAVSDESNGFVWIRYVSSPNLRGVITRLDQVTTVKPFFEEGQEWKEGAHVPCSAYKVTSVFRRHGRMYALADFTVGDETGVVLLTEEDYAYHVE